MIPEQERYELHETLRLRLGDGPAATLMTRLFGMDPERIATKDDVAAVGGEIAEMRREIAEMHGEIAEMHGEIAKVHAEMHGEIAKVRGEMHGEIVKVHGEIAKVRLDNARQTRQLTLTILIAFLTQFAATAAVIVTVG